MPQIEIGYSCKEKTNDFIDDEVFLVEKNGIAVIIESPCFFDNIKELESYIVDYKLDVAGMLLSYHMAGGTFLPDVKKYATKKADEYGHMGGGKGLITKFADAFDNIFDSAIHTITDYMVESTITIGGIQFIITETPDAFDIEIPEVNTVYTHMLGHDCHSIIAGKEHADSIIDQLNSYSHNNYTLILSSHYTPEDLKDVSVKIHYIKDIISIASQCSNACQFKEEVMKQYPDYGGENYLDMTAGFFFS